MRIMQKMMEIMDSHSVLEECVDAFFSYFCTLMPLKVLGLGFMDVPNLRIFMLTITDNTGTTPYYQYKDLTSKDHAPLSPPALEVFRHIEDRIITDPQDPALEFLRIAPAGLNLEPPIIQLRCPSNNLSRGGGTFSFYPDVPLPPDIMDILQAVRMPLNIFVMEHFRYWQLEQEKACVLAENEELRKKSHVHVPILGSSGGLRREMETLVQLAPLDAPLLITGETGTGKELFAKAAHALSRKHKGPFVAVNCGAIPESLIDNELFGHAKGAFTGATEVYRGKFERAAGGTLFLDEIGELPLQVQSRLLRVLETKTVERLGGSQVLPVDFRLICATHRDLTTMVDEGTFRQDVYYRLAVLKLHIPPLRERVQDIPLLAQHFVSHTASGLGIAPPRIPAEEMAVLCAYNWPGNVRELQNCIEEAVALCQGGVLHFTLGEAGKRHIVAASRSAYPQQSPQDIVPYDAMMTQYLGHALAHCQGKIQGNDGMAALLGLHPSTLRAKLRKYGVRG